MFGGYDAENGSVPPVALKVYQTVTMNVAFWNGSDYQIVQSEIF